MNTFAKTFVALLGLALAAAFAAAAYYAYQLIVSLFTGLDVQVARIAAITSIVVLLAAAIVASAIRAASGKGRATQMHEQKSATYQLFVEYWEGVIASGRTSALPNSADAAGKSRALDHLLALYGGASVIKAHDALRAARDEKGAQNADVAARFGKALLEIRKDLGSGTQGLGGPELLRLVAPDADPTISHARADHRLA